MKMALYGLLVGLIAGIFIIMFGAFCMSEEHQQAMSYCSEYFEDKGIEVQYCDMSII